MLGFRSLMARPLLTAAIAGTIFLIRSADTETKSMSNLQKPRPKVIFLDVNETLLELTPLKVNVTKALEEREGMVGLWFSQLPNTTKP